MMSKCAWLVDMAYVVKAAKQSKMRLDYIATVGLLKQWFQNVDTFLFNSFDERYGIPEGLQNFYNLVKCHGMSVRLHPMSGSVSDGTHRQRRVDVDFAAHAVWQASLEDVAAVVITSGDQDFVPVLEVCRERFTKQAWLMTFQSDVSARLKTLADKCMLFEDYRESVELTSKH